MTFVQNARACDAATHPARCSHTPLHKLCSRSHCRAKSKVGVRLVAHSLAGSFACRALLSRHNRNSPEATTMAEPITSDTVGTSSQIANPKMLAQMRER